MVTGTARGQIDQFVHVGWTGGHAIRMEVDERSRFDYSYPEFEINNDYMRSSHRRPLNEAVRFTSCFDLNG
jgi:hypothetical protein